MEEGLRFAQITPESGVHQPFATMRAYVLAQHSVPGRYSWIWVIMSIGVPLAKILPQLSPKFSLPGSIRHIQSPDIHLESNYPSIPR